MIPYRILLVDDELIILTAIGHDLESRGYQVTTAGSGEKAIELLHEKSFDLVITDLIMGQTDGLQVLQQAKKLNPEVMVIILTAYGNLESAVEALRMDVDDYLVKPYESEELYFRVNKCLDKYELKRKIGAYEKILPVCCMCKKIRDDSGKEPGSGGWVTMERYLHVKAGLEITSSYCPECAKKVEEDLKQSM